ncbi:MAG: hypothetical protein ACO2PP_17300 [Thermocrinis sp.]|jgi:hypothetical protein|uniref:hypothetical protein n=1 Tax=Thermocrinis sp. TaxID=2024383 RepID=UPI003BFAEF61
MAVSPEDLAAGAIALQVFVKNAQYVEIIVNVAFGAIPTILGLGAAGLLGSGIINTAKEVRNSISLLKTVGPGLLYGAVGLNIGRTRLAERLKQSNHWLLQGFGNVLTPYQWIKSKWKKNNQDTQGKQEEQDRSGSGNPPPPPDIKADKKEQNNKEEKPRPIEPSYGFSDSPLGKIFKRDNK